MMAVAAEVVAREAVVAARAVEAARAPGRAVAEALGRKKSMQLNLPPWRPRSAWRVCAVQCLYPLFLSSRDTSRQKPKHHTQHLSLPDPRCKYRNGILQLYACMYPDTCMIVPP